MHKATSVEAPPWCPCRLRRRSNREAIEQGVERRIIDLDVRGARGGSLR